METLDQDLGKENLITFNSIGFLRETAKWAKVISIVGFIGIGLLVILSLFIGSYFSMIGGAPPNFPTGVLTGVYLAMAALYFFPVFYLFKFSQNMKAAIDGSNSMTYEKAFEYLKSHYKYIGILTVIVISLYAVMFLVGILGGLIN